MLDQIIELIEQFDTICIYRHILPDGDAKGSQFGMKSWIKNKWPDKKVVAIGKDTPNSFSRIVIRKALIFQKHWPLFVIRQIVKGSMVKAGINVQRSSRSIIILWLIATVI